MRKFNVRWWRDDQDWNRQRYEQMIRQWNEQRGFLSVVDYFKSRYPGPPFGFYADHQPYTYWQVPQETLDQLNRGLSRN